MRAQVGQVINNKYRLLRLIGDGGMGSVYEARHEVLGTSVALKFLHPELMKRGALVQRFMQEARVSAQIQSLHVVRVTDVDQMGTGAFIVMEYLEGKSLQTLYEDLYKAGMRLSYPDALEYAMQMLDGLEAAHKASVVHRDLKPDNVMITLDGKGRSLLKLLDFGIAKLRQDNTDRALTRPGVIMGTPEYMAPEQAFSADAVDHRADIFSMGVMIFEMLAGRRPVGGDDPIQIAGAYLSGQISRLTDLAPEIDPVLADAVHRAMAASVADRIQTAAALRDAIEPFAIAARVPSVMPATPSLSNPGLSRASLVSAASPLPPMVAAAAGASSVPKTLPPEGEDEPRLDTNPADPPRMSDAPAHLLTPVGGYSSAAEAARHSGGFVPPTRSVAPLSRQDPNATAFAAPLSMEPVRASGTAIADRGSVHSVAMGAAQGVRPSQPGYAPEAANGFGTAPDGIAIVGAPPPYVPPQPAPQRKSSPFSSLPVILALAACIAGVVVGGLYLAQSHAKADDHEDPPAPPPPTTVVRSDPPPPTDVPANTGPTLAPSAPVKPPSVPLKVPPKGSSSPGIQPPPARSGDPFVIMIPTSIPFFPFAPGQSDPPRQQPQQQTGPRNRQQQDPQDPMVPPAPRQRRSPPPPQNQPPDGPYN